MKISFKDFFNISDDDIKNEDIKIETCITIGEGGPAFIDKWLEKSEQEKENGKFEHLFRGWSSKRNRNYTKLGMLAYSFIKLPSGDDWLFVSGGIVREIPKTGVFDKINLEQNQVKIEISEKYQPYFGRLVVNFKRNLKGKQAQQLYSFTIKKFLEWNPTIKELLPTKYSKEKFEGYDKVHLDFKKLKRIFNGEILPTYKEALEAVKGVYCLTDIETGKLYIGSATGLEGVAQRWGNYLDSKHGGNKQLISLYNEKGAKYFEENFYFSIIEYFSLSYDDNKIIERESYWKDVFATKKHGYNDN
ncbi:GIY-YIG nuclease family protein [Mycoplasma sp. OR1901]|uniref:GIY-YIG nuclease family protein n=1 Tax=Mycoplasma sp. OR1901 TaxID=2742195 RepID=UPI00158338DC|nr:GIY-YIG nuclease family protein [Mycoplasma sp. OR1901]QKT05483.1 GIY-YIG nuclease family protein [Mycoplasma sp. OR1901]